MTMSIESGRLNAAASVMALVWALGAPACVWAQESAQQKSSSVDEVTVVGSRLKTVTSAVQAVTVMDRAEIDRLGATTTGDLLKYLPQQSFYGRYTNAGSAQLVQLRGLGVGTTLVLVNGRRAVPGAIGGTSLLGGFDINSIPVAVIDHVEVLTDGASAIYGADAVGGVINIVLKSKVERPTVDLSYGAADGGAQQSRASASLGWNKGRAQGAVVFDYFEREALLASKRDILANQDYRRFGGVDRRVLTTNPGNVCAVSGNLPGLSTPCAAVPAGSTGIGLTPANFLATAGLQNLGNPARRASAVVQPSRTYSVMANGSFDLSANTRLFGEFSYGDRRDVIVTASNLVSNGLVSAANPYNPFKVPVRVNFVLGGDPLSQRYFETNYREVVGANGRFGRWDWEVAFSGVQSSGKSDQKNYFDATRLAASLAATTPDAALNPFMDGPGGSPELLRSIVVPQQLLSDYTSDAYQVGGFVRGDLFNLPAGSIQLVLGTEWRQESIDQISGVVGGANAKAKREASAAYFESRLPLLGSGVGAVGDLSLTVAGRYDNYNDFGATFNAQYSLDWHPVPSLLVRGYYGDSYRAPALVFLNQVVAPVTGVAITDPRRNNEQVLITTIGGGNPNLKPETSTSKSLTAIWTPAISGSPRFSLTGWNIQQDRRLVGNVTGQVYLANEAYLPAGIINRDTPTAGDLAANRPGKLLSIYRKNVNLGTLDTSGIDAEASATFVTELGRFSPRVGATYVSKFAAQDFVTSPVVERAGYANTSGSIPRWKAVASLAWDAGGWGASSTLRYTPSYKDVTDANVPTGTKVKAQPVVDVQVSVDLARAFALHGPVTQGLNVRLGVVNLFDREPGYTQTSSLGFDTTQADIRQRFVYASLSKTF